MSAPSPPLIVLEPANGGLALVRRLVREGMRVTLLVTPSEAHMLRCRGVRGAVVPFEGAGDAWLEALAAEVDGGEALVLTGADRASACLARRRGELPPGLRAFEAADTAHLPLMDKASASRIARAAGLRVPWTATVDSPAAAERAAAEAPYPCVLKPVFSHDWRAVHGVERVLTAHDPPDFERYAQRGLAHGLAMIANEYVPGGDGCVEEAIVVRAADGTFPVSFAVRKIRQFPVGFGAASLCVTATLPETTEMTRRLLQEAGFVGVAGVEFKRHRETGERFVLDANVRLPTQWGVGDVAGADASRRTIACLGGDVLGPAPPPRDGVRLVFPELEVRAALAHLSGADGARGKAVTARRLLRSYRGTQDAGLLDPRDPGPALSYLAAAVSPSRSARRPASRSRAAAAPVSPDGRASASAAHPPSRGHGR